MPQLSGARPCPRLIVSDTSVAQNDRRLVRAQRTLTSAARRATLIVGLASVTCPQVGGADGGASVVKLTVLPFLELAAPVPACQ